LLPLKPDMRTLHVLCSARAKQGKTERYRELFRTCSTPTTGSCSPGEKAW